MRSPDRRPRAVHLVLRPRPVPRHRALSRAPRDVQATVSPSTVPLASGGSRARRTRRDRTTEKRRVRSVGAERRPRHATGRHDVRGDGVRAGQRRSARVGGGCGKRVGGADVVREAPTRASARGHTVTIVQETFERRLEPRRGRGDERGEIRDGGGTRVRGGDSATAAAGTAGTATAGTIGFVSRFGRVSSGLASIVDERPIGKLGGVGIGDAPRERLSDGTRRGRSGFLFIKYFSRRRYEASYARRTMDKPTDVFAARLPTDVFATLRTRRPRTTGQFLSSVYPLSFRRPPVGNPPRRVRRSRLLRARLSSRGEVKECLRERGLTERVPLDDLSRGGVERGATAWRVPADASPRVHTDIPSRRPTPPGPRGGGRRGRHQRVRRLRVFARRGVRTRVASVAPITSELYLERVRRAVTRLEFPRRADVNHATVRHRDDAGRARAPSLVHRVRRRQHGAAATRVVHQSTPHATTRGRVDRARGRVENQHRGVAHRRGRERDAAVSSRPSNAQSVSASVEDDSPFGDPFGSRFDTFEPFRRDRRRRRRRARRARGVSRLETRRRAPGVPPASPSRRRRRRREGTRPRPRRRARRRRPFARTPHRSRRARLPRKGPSRRRIARASLSRNRAEPTTHTISPGSTPNHTFAAPPARARDDSRSSPNSESLGAETPHAANANVGASRASPTSSPNDPVDARLANRSTRSRSATTKGDVAAVAASVAAASTAPADDPSRSLRRVAHSAATSATPHATAPHRARRAERDEHAAVALGNNRRDGRSRRYRRSTRATRRCARFRARRTTGQSRTPRSAISVSRWNRHPWTRRRRGGETRKRREKNTSRDDARGVVVAKRDDVRERERRGNGREKRREHRGRRRGIPRRDAHRRSRDRRRARANRAARHVRRERRRPVTPGRETRQRQRETRRRDAFGDGGGDGGGGGRAHRDGNRDRREVRPRRAQRRLLRKVHHRRRRVERRGTSVSDPSRVSGPGGGGGAGRTPCGTRRRPEEDVHVREWVVHDARGDASRAEIRVAETHA